MRTVGGQRQSPPPRAEGPQGPPLRETVGSPVVPPGVWSPPVPHRVELPAKAGKAGKASTDAAAIAPPPSRLRAAVADRSGGRSDARALDNSAPAGAARYGVNASAYRLRLAASSALLKSLRHHSEPPGLGFAPALPAAWPGARTRPRWRAALRGLGQSAIKHLDNDFLLVGG